MKEQRKWTGKKIIEHFLELGHRLQGLSNQHNKGKRSTPRYVATNNRVKEWSQKFSKEKKKIAWRQASQHRMLKMGEVNAFQMLRKMDSI